MNVYSLINKLNIQGVTVSLKEGQLKVKAPKGALTDDLRNELIANKQDIITFLQRALERNKIPSFFPVKRTDEYARPIEAFPLSFSQQRLWFIDSLQEGSAEYNMPLAFEITGQLNLALVTDVLNSIIERHEILRTVYITEDNKTLQHIRSLSEFAFEIQMEDLSHLTGEMLDVQIKALIETDITRPFNLATDLMLRVSYVKKTSSFGVLTFNMHHIASDGWSMEVLVKEFFALYLAYSQGKVNPLPSLDFQYVDYAYWQRDYLTGEILESQLNYWKKQLDDLPGVHSLPLDYVRPSVKLHKGAVVTSQLSTTIAQQLLMVAEQHELTPFMLLHGALSLLLSRHSNCADIVIGTPVANRLQVEFEPVIGFFVNTLVLRTDTNHDTLADYFAHIRQVHLDAQSNQDVPFEQLVELLKIPRSNAHGPLFQIMMTTNTDYGLNDASEVASFTLPGVEIQAYESDLAPAKFDLNIDLSISEQGVALHWTYDVSLFTGQHIEQLNEHLCRLLEGLSQTKGQSTQAPYALPLLSASEIEYLVHDLNDTAIDYPKDKCIHELFEQQVVDNPEKVAVVFEDKQLTYKQLNEKANQLAHYLKEHHDIKPDTLVGLCVERSLEMVIGILGILKAGGAYVPLDPDYPTERLSYMLKDAALDVVLSQTQVQDVLIGFSGTIVTLDELSDTDNSLLSDYANSNLTIVDTGINSSHLAYVIYTSGSTGQPKGVLTEHISVVRLVINSDFMCLNNETVMLQSANIAFDAATLGIWGPLLNGGQCILYPYQYLSSEELNGIIEKYQVNSLWLTAGLFREWSYDVPDASSLKYLLAGGDVLDPDAIKRVQRRLPELTLINGYGPTENTTFSTTYTFEQPHSLNIVPIGKKLSTDEAYILNAVSQIVPYGTVGELYVGGDGLARGYLNRPDLTATRFIDSPFYDENKANSSARLYKTGDLVHYLPDGNLAFMGRADDQVKIRGFRIEFGEVEAQLAKLESVDSALLIARKLAGSQQLVGYIKPAIELTGQSGGVYVKGVLDELKTQLPKYMIPSIIMVVDEWPLTPNGKVDRKALPIPDGSAMEYEYIAPTTETERVLVGIWAGLLNISQDTISAKANFFELGGHSLLIIRLLSCIKQEFGLTLEVQGLYEIADIQELGKFCDSLIIKMELKHKLTQHADNELEEVEF